MKFIILPRNENPHPLRKTGFRLSITVLGAFLLVGALLLLTACAPRSEGEGASSSDIPAGTPSPDLGITVKGDTASSPGQRIHRTITFDQQWVPDGSYIVWKPPKGSTSVDIYTNMERIGRTEDGGYIFRYDVGANIFPVFPAPYLAAEYQLPYQPEAEGWMEWTSVTADGQPLTYSTAYIENEDNGGESQVRASSRFHLSSAPTDDYWYQHVTQEFWSTTNLTMTAESSRKIVEPWQENSMFYAIEIPIPSEPITQYRQLPIQFGSNLTPTLRLIDLDTARTSVVTASLEYRPDRIALLSTLDPPREDTIWVAMGVADSVDFGQETFELEHWEWDLDMNLDLGGQPMGQQADSAPPLIKTYYCLEGKTQSAAMALLLRSWGGTAHATSSQGVTCVGPQPVYLTDRPIIDLGPAHTVQITTTQPISFSHYIYPSQTMTLTLDYHSTLGADWGLYRRPDLTEPIAPSTPLTVSPGMGLQFWVAARTPVTATEGAYSLIITAKPLTSPELAVWTADSIWVALPPTATPRQLWLPLIVGR